MISRPQNLILRSRDKSSDSTQVCVTMFLFVSSIIISQLRRPIEFKFSQISYCMQCWDTLSEKTGIWQLPKVSILSLKYCLKLNATFQILTLCFDDLPSFWHDASVSATSAKKPTRATRRNSLAIFRNEWRILFESEVR